MLFGTVGRCRAEHIGQACVVLNTGLFAQSRCPHQAEAMLYTYLCRRPALGNWLALQRQLSQGCGIRPAGLRLTINKAVLT